MIRRAASRALLPVALVLAVSPWAPATPRAAVLDGRVTAELEYLGENYFSEIDIPIPSLDVDTFQSTDTTRFTEDTWLPGQRLELHWSDAMDNGTDLDLRSRTGYNRDRFFEDLEMEASHGGPGRDRWTMRLEGSFRDESRSLVGDGDWRAGVELERRLSPSEDTETRLRFGYLRSRTRGDTTSFLYDYDRFEARATVVGGGTWLPVFEGSLRGVRKAVAFDLEGSYGEAVLLGSWRPERKSGLSLGLRTRYRDYDAGGEVGRDFAEVELEVKRDLLARKGTRLRGEIEVQGADYRGSDELYYDFLEVEVRFPLSIDAREWRLDTSPRVRLLRDLEGADRDYAQWSLRVGAGRSVGTLGFFELSVEPGYRDYRSSAEEVIELTALSATLLRSDYWLLDVMLIADLPLGEAYFIDVLADTLLETHPTESERVWVTLVNLGVGRRF